MGKLWETVLKLTIGAMLTGGLAWGSYLEGQVDSLKQNDVVLLARIYKDDEDVAVMQANFNSIKESLARIEGTVTKGRQ